MLKGLKINKKSLKIIENNWLNIWQSHPDFVSLLYEIERCSFSHLKLKI
jgi:hypothetical protein